jgi:hypothetical protein
MSTRGNDLNNELVKWLLKITNEKKHNINVQLSKCATSARIAQSNLIRTIQGIPEYDYALFLDTDITPPTNIFETLIPLDKDIVTAPIWFFDENTSSIHLNVHYTTHAEYLDRIYYPKASGVEEIIGSSFGCLLVKKRVLDKFKEVGEDPVVWSSLIDNCWRTGENDNVFFAKAGKLGFKSYVCWDARGGTHRRVVNLNDKVLGDFLLRNYKHVSEILCQETS